jgi:hypothetical protein
LWISEASPWDLGQGNDPLVSPPPHSSAPIEMENHPGPACLKTECISAIEQYSSWSTDRATAKYHHLCTRLSYIEFDLDGVAAAFLRVFE